MNIKYYEEIFPYIIVDDMYDEQQLEYIWEELNFLCYDEKLEPDPDKTGGAYDKDGKYLKRNKCIWLDKVYSDRKYSNVLTFNRKLFAENMKIFKAHSSWFFKYFQCTSDTTLLSYYENGDYYEPHYDTAMCTALTWFYKKPKSFVGGDITLFTDSTSVKIKCKNNRTLIFPSIILHSVDQIHMDEENMDVKKGRFCMTQFLDFK